MLDSSRPMNPRRITAASLILLAAGCGNPFKARGTVSYAQYNALEKGMKSEAVLNALGPPDDVMEADGKVRGMSYLCEDGSGKVVGLRLVFDKDGGLEKWTLRSEKSS